MSEIKVNKITPRTACGTTTLGDSGDTFTVASGATIQNLGTATGFGGTGVVSWDTSSIKTTGFTAVTGTGYFCNTTGGAFTVTLPLSPSAGDVVGVSDYAQTFDTNNLTLGRNGSNIGGIAVDATISTEGVSVTLVYVDATKGWIVTDSGNQSDAPTATFLTATGGCIVTCGNYKTHIFTGPSTFTVCSLGNSAGSTSVDYLVVAGGGSGGTSSSSANGGAGGGAGGFRTTNGYGIPAPLTSPLAPCASLPVAVQPYAIVVGGGGPATAGPTCSCGSKGSDSSFSTITSTGGGFGSGNADHPTVPGPGGPGGSGGGTHQNTAGTGNDPPTSPSQGNNGGGGSSPSASGGGGAGAVGGDAAVGCASNAGPGGDGSYIGDGFINPTAPSYGTPGPASSTRYFAGGGGGANSPSRSPAGTVGTGGAGGGGASAGTSGTAGTINTGGGGGGTSAGGSSGAGGSGIVMIRYKYQ